MTLAYPAKLGFNTRKTDIEAQKINSSTLVTYEMVIIGFLVEDRLEKVWFFEEIFLLANTSIKVILEMLFLTLFNTDIWFAEKKLE